MQTSRASTRRAALAAFLLFAAGLFVVGPAEASRTTTDARPGLTSMSSRELASLELSMLEPVEPADSASISSRFGFAEDLSLLDVEARPCGFELFGGVGTSRCALTYARNNPIRFTDPDGRMVNLGAIGEQKDRESLIAGLQDKTGLKLGVAGENLVITGAVTGANGKMAGSATARADLMRAIGGDKTFFAQSLNDSPGVNLGATTLNGSLIRLDFSDIAKVNTGKNSPRTFDSSMIFLHELAHAQDGLTDPSKALRRAIPTVRGAVVDHMNSIRRQLGLQDRLQYQADQRNGRTFIPFASGPVYVPSGVD